MGEIIGRLINKTSFVYINLKRKLDLYYKSKRNKLNLYILTYRLYVVYIIYNIYLVEKFHNVAWGANLWDVKIAIDKQGALWYNMGVSGKYHIQERWSIYGLQRTL